ncbi:peptide deformylase [Mariprofundus ferrooxydans]|uniref:Peptide deformylase n=1 Tax=Mariprofundus ferrooxydans PV-1 TaxID=314345 RepID=Q0F0I6_9PROT|nr:peptide deformylase [Mariprofundus ferrooxydans]EAU55042.1 Formylmethionine deformylase [Mariprofundus ferrooxydans PV-1]KON46913.1 peptide deformylase [Mariprofundus ferrooxydans]
MAVREILIHPDDRLVQVSRPVEFPLSDEVKELIRDMADTMYDAPGVGLAAPQVGELLRIAVTDTVWRDKEVRHDGDLPGGHRELKVWINPEFLWKSDEMETWEEGCLSVPETWGDVSRPAALRLRWFDEHGVQHEQDFDGFQAVALQHEFDHLDGKLFIDYLSPLKRRMITKKMKKLYKS